MDLGVMDLNAMSSLLLILILLCWFSILEGNRKQADQVNRDNCDSEAFQIKLGKVIYMIILIFRMNFLQETDPGVPFFRCYGFYIFYAFISVMITVFSSTAREKWMLEHKFICFRLQLFLKDSHLWVVEHKEEYKEEIR